MNKKKFDVIIGILTYNRFNLLSVTLASLLKEIDFSSLSYKILIFDNGSNNTQLVKNKRLKEKYGVIVFDLGREINTAKDDAERDKLISNGHGLLSKLMIEYNSMAYFIIEDDWNCIRNIDIRKMIKVLTDTEIGQIRLRKCKYDGSLNGFSKVNFITKEDIVWSSSIKTDNGHINFGNLHWTNTPSLVSADSLEIISKGFNSEIDCMKAFHKIHPINAQVVPGIFVHTGPTRIRKDLREKGYI